MKEMNFNEMREALVYMRDKGNRGVITAKLCEELGIGSAYYTHYRKGIEDLFVAVCGYCRIKNSPKSEMSAIAEAREKVIPLWKELLSCGEIDKFENDLRVMDDDISNLVSFCQMFVDNKNDLSRGKSTGFSAQKVWANDDLKKFQKKVETDIGIRIAQVDVLSPEALEFLRKERKILSAWKKAESKIEELTKRKGELLILKDKLPEAAAEVIDKEIAKIDADITAANEDVSKSSKKLDTLHGKVTEKSAEEDKAE